MSTETEITSDVEEDMVNFLWRSGITRPMMEPASSTAEAVDRLGDIIATGCLGVFLGLCRVAEALNDKK